MSPKRKAQRAINVSENGAEGIVIELNTLDDKIDTSVSSLTEQIEIVRKTEVIGPIGPTGKDGYTPIKNVDYFDGKDGRNPLTVSDTEPLNPQKGDLWYQI